MGTGRWTAGVAIMLPFLPLLANSFGWIFTGEYPWLLAAVCAVDWFVVNLLNRVVDLARAAGA